MAGKLSSPVGQRDVNGFPLANLIASGSYTLGRAARLGGRGAFDKAFKSGRTERGNALVARFVENGGVQARLGVVVPRRAIRKAVRRHRIKRLIRESFRHHKDLIPGWDIVVQARSGLDRIDNAAIAATLEQLWVDIQRHG